MSESFDRLTVALRGRHTESCVSVAPDGRSFYFISALPGNPSQLVVVLNWFEELKAEAGR